MNTLNRILTGALVLALSLGILGAQTSITSTTLSTAVSSTSVNEIVVASATGFTAGTTAAFVDGEYMPVLGVSSTRIRVQRGGNGTRSVTHKSGARVWVAPFAAYRAGPDPQGQCVRTALSYVPVINVNTGNTFDCLGVTTAGQYVQTNKPGIPVLGSTVASATSITPTGTYFIVSGTTAVATIAVPAGWEPGMCIQIQPSGIFATTTADNIGLITSAAVVGRILTMCWNGTDWFPSYVS